MIRHFSLLITCVLTIASLIVSCGGLSIDTSLKQSYQSYQKNDCEDVFYTLSYVERQMAPRTDLQPEISMLRGMCLEQQHLYQDAIGTYTFIMATFPESEYAYRAKARIKVLSEPVSPTPK